MSRKDPFRTLDDDKPRLPAGSVTTSELAAGSVETAKIAAGAVTAGTIQANSVRLYSGVGGWWDLPAGRPGRLRRLVVWLLLGWKWKDHA
jgi:hypothetical protein